MFPFCIPWKDQKNDVVRRYKIGTFRRNDLMSQLELVRNHFLVSLPKKTTSWYVAMFGHFQWSLKRQSPDYKAFQLTDIFPFTSQCPHNYVHFFQNYCYLIFYYPNSKTLFKLFASPYIIHHIHEYHHPWPLVSESQDLHFLLAIHLMI